MKFFHGTTIECWNKIQKEGVLWGIRNAPSRVTYLTNDKKIAEHYGDVILEIDYDVCQGTNNYIDDCWQHREYEPIFLECITVCDIMSR